MNKKLLVLSLIVIIAAISASVVSYTTQQSQIEPQRVQTISSAMLDIPMEKLSGEAKYAIVGKVVKITPVTYTDPEKLPKKYTVDAGVIFIGDEILSDVKIKVKEDLFGKYNKKFITVRVPGGETPQQKTIYENSPHFKKGERVIIFVGKGQSYNISEDHYTVLGLDQGTVKLGEKIKSKFADMNTSETQMKDKIKSLKNKD